MDRSHKTDKYIESLFGKPDYSKSFIKDGFVYTPFNNVRLWRVDNLSNFKVIKKTQERN